MRDLYSGPKALGPSPRSLFVSRKYPLIICAALQQLLMGALINQFSFLQNKDSIRPADLA